MKYLHKLKNISSLKKIIKEYKEKGQKIVFTNGCFDIIHPGHIKILKSAKSHGDILVVALNSDSSVKKLKGPRRPILNQKARVQIVSALEFIDYVILFNETTPYALIKEIQPDILVKGGDWKMENIVGRNVVKKVIRVKPDKNYSTTAVINKILKTYHDET